eukprot:jgi/Mesvir1/14151/Mv25982-RA.1
MGGLGGIVQGELHQAQKFLPIAAHCVGVVSHGLLHCAVQPLHQMRRRAVIGRAQRHLGAQPFEKLLPEFGREELVAVGDELSAEPVKPKHVRQVYLGALLRREVGRTRGQVTHARQAVHEHQDHAVAALRLLERADEVHHDSIPRTHRIRQRLRDGLRARVPGLHDLARGALAHIRLDILLHPRPVEMLAGPGKEAVASLMSA